MAKDSKIEWTHHTFNPWWGCVRVSPACKHCYAEAWAKRVGQKVWGSTAPRRHLSDSYWKAPLAWNAEAARTGVRNRVFCASMADVFEARDDLAPLRERLWELIYATPHLDWLLLTKRPEHVRACIPWGQDWPKNVWLGATAETQLWAERRVPHLLATNAEVLFLSCEPLLGPLDLSPWLTGSRRAIDWVIVGGESGHGARAMNPEWARSVRDQCVEAGVGFHFKQWGNWRPADEGHVNGFETRNVGASDGNRIVMVNVGKKAAGRQLDGMEWNGLPWHV